MTSGWQFVNGAWYYLNGSGEMQTGWQYVGNNGIIWIPMVLCRRAGSRSEDSWYYLNGNGEMTTGWQFVGGRWYYLGGNGVMYANTWTPDGRYVDGSGVWVQ